MNRYNSPARERLPVESSGQWGAGAVDGAGEQARSGEQSVAQAGERAVIELIRRDLPRTAISRVGNGDDAAVLNTRGLDTVLSVDMVVEDQHFRRAWSTPQEVGRRAVAQSVADIEAMGAVPASVVVALALPAQTPLSVVERLYAGIVAEATRARVEISGGDVVTSPVLSLAVTSVGTLSGRAITTAGARVGDVVILAGEIGWSAAGWDCCEQGLGGGALGGGEQRGISALPAREQGLVARALAAFRVPPVPYGAGAAAAAAGAHSLTDVSDGLVSDLLTIARASHVTMEITTESIPDLSEVAELSTLLRRAELTRWVLSMGEDHALVGTCAADAIPPGFRAVGRVVAGPGQVRIDGQVAEAAGWDSLAGDPGRAAKRTGGEP